MGARGVFLVVAALGSAGLGLLGSETGVLARPELASVDARFDVRGERAPHPDVVIVGLDSTSLATLGEQPPIPRRYHARMIDELHRRGARRIAYDFQFLGETTVRDDNALFRALRRAGGVIIGSTIAEDGQTPYDGLARATGSLVGMTNFPTSFGTIREIRLVEEGVAHFAALAAGARARSTERAWIDFAGPTGTYERLPFSDVLAGRGDVADKIVLVGAIDPILQDIHASSTGEAMPGVEVNANAVATILEDFPLRDPPGWLAFALIAGLGVIVPLAALRLHGLRWMPLVLLAPLYLVAAQLAFDGGTVLPVAAPLTALIAGSAGTLGIAYATDLRQRRRLRESFARFVPASVVDEVAERGRLPGEERVATVLFCDLRGFTTLAESMRAEEVIALLDRYLGTMSDAILDHGGTVVSYMGDGIMAVFGAPVAQDDHADRALAAAREMLRRLPSLGDLRMGVGLSTGPVMSGTVGSERRLEYAAVGDTTNTAARLEAMTKDAGVPILIADSTKQALRDPEGLRSFGEVEVRGRQAKLTAWTLP